MSRSSGRIRPRRRDGFVGARAPRPPAVHVAGHRPPRACGERSARDRRARRTTCPRSCACREGLSFGMPSAGEVYPGRWASGSNSTRRRRSTCSSSEGQTSPARRRRLRRVGGARHLVVEGTALGGQRERRGDRGLPRLPGGHQWLGADGSRRRTGAEIRRPHGSPYRAVALEPDAASPRPARERPVDRGARRRPCDRRGVPPASDPRDRVVRRRQHLLLRGAEEARRCSATRSVSSAAELGGAGGDLARPRWRARDALPPPRRPQRDDVGLPDPRPRARRRPRPRTQRDRRAPRRRRPARGGDAPRRRADPALLLFLFLEPHHTPTGSAARSRSTTTASSSPARGPVPRASSRQRARCLRGGRCSLGVGQALRHRGRRRSDGRALRPRALRRRRRRGSGRPTQLRR